MQGILGSSATCVREQRLSPGLLPCQVTDEPMATKPFMAIKLVNGSTPVAVGPLPSVPWDRV